MSEARSERAVEVRQWHPGFLTETTVCHEFDGAYCDDTFRVVWEVSIVDGKRCPGNWELYFLVGGGEWKSKDDPCVAAELARALGLVPPGGEEEKG